MEKEYKETQSPDDGLQEKPNWEEIVFQARRDGWVVCHHPFYGWLLEEYVGPGSEVAVPDWIASLCEKAFRDRTDLTSITLPKRLKFIDRCAFSGCTGLTSVTIPKSVTEVSYAAFYSCTGLAEIKVDAKNKYYREVDGLLLELRRRRRGDEEDFNVLGGMRPGVYEEEDGAEDSPVWGDMTSGMYEEDLYALSGMTPRTYGDCESYEEYYVLHSCPPGKTGTLAIPEGIRGICDNAFSGCTGLTHITIPEDLEIGQAASCGYTGLTRLTIPESVLEIGNAVFSGCKSLIRVVLPDSIRKIGSSAFSGCKSLTHIKIPGNNTYISPFAFKGCTGLTGVVLPKGLIEICEGAFSGCTSLSDMIFPEKVAQIGKGAFKGCMSLSGVVIPEGITKIGSEAFSGCTGLTGVVLPESVTEIGEGAFQGCTGLSSVVITEGVTKIGEGAFQSCTSLEEIQVASGNQSYRVINGLLVSLDGCILHSCPAGKSGMLAVPEGVREIGSNAFSGCAGLSGVTLPKSVSSVSKSAFQGCTGLVEIQVDEGNNRYRAIDGLLVGRGGSFLHKCPPGRSGILKIPESITFIGRYAFEGCSLAHIIVPESISEIGKYAFSGCMGLTEITLPESVTKIDNSAFSDCTGLTGITLPRSIREIGDSAFSGCTGLTEIILPRNIREIGDNAFSDCAGLTKIILPEDITKIAQGTFSHCTGLTEVTLPEGVAEIDSCAFFCCTGLTRINLPESVIRIDDAAFYNCISLAELTFPKGIRRISSNAFSGCTSLRTAIPETKGDDCPEGDEMGSRDYRDQNDMAADTLKGATEIKPHAFAAWVELKEVDIPEGVIKICDDAFRDCWRLSRVDIPKSVTEIGRRAFQGCTGLAEVTLPEGLREISSQTFRNCFRLSHVVIPKSVRAIRKGAFEGCKRLSQVTIPEGVRVINSEAFKDCAALSQVYIPKSVRAIFGDTFQGCIGLTIHAPTGSYAEEYAGCLGIEFSGREEQMLELVPDGDGQGCVNMENQDRVLLTLEERLKYAAESQASSPEAAVRMVQKFSGIPAWYFFCGKEDLAAMNELTGKFWEHSSVDINTYHGFCQTFRLAITYDTACRMLQTGTVLSAEDFCNPCQPVWSAGTVNAVILLGLMLLDHAKGRVKNKDIYHCMRMTLRQYLDALAEFASGKEGKTGSSRTDFRLLGQSILKSCDGSGPLGEALADILRHYIAAQQEFGRLDHILRCMDALSCCLEEQGGIQADSARRFREVLNKYCPGLEGQKLIEEGGRSPDPYGHYLALAGEYPEDVPDPGSEGLALRTVRSQVFLPGYDCSPESLRALAAQTPFRDFREILEKNICEERMTCAMKEINASAVYLYTLWVKPYLPAEGYRFQL